MCTGSRPVRSTAVVVANSRGSGGKPYAKDVIKRVNMVYLNFLNKRLSQELGMALRAPPQYSSEPYLHSIPTCQLNIF